MNRKSLILMLAASLSAAVCIVTVASTFSGNPTPVSSDITDSTSSSQQTQATASTKAPVIVEGISADISIASGKSEVISPSLSDGDDINSSVWTSDNESIVTVDDGGRIDAVSEGSAKVTARIGNKEFTYNITVTEKEENVYDGYSTCYIANSDILAENLYNIYEKNPYYIKVNKTQNCVTVYTYDEYGEYTVPVRAMVCSCGLDGATVTGDFSIYYNQLWNPLYGDVYGYYVSGFYGDYLFHSVPFYYDSSDSLKVEEYNKLGQDGSLGCVRMAVADVKWIYENCAIDTPVTVYEDENPGPLGKPEAIKITDFDCGWDPTDDDENNPYKYQTPQISGVSSKIINKGETFNILDGITATDTCSNDITNEIVATGNVLTEKEGTYKISYYVEDVMHRSATAEMTVTVV